MCSCGDIGNFVFSVYAHGNRLCRRRCSVIVGSVGYIHTCQFADHGLELKDGLKHALADFSLIGGIGGQKFFFRYYAVYDGRNEVIIGAGSSEDALKDNIHVCEFFHFAGNLHFAHSRRKIERSFEFYLIGNTGKHIVKGSITCFLQHFLPFL